MSAYCRADAPTLIVAAIARVIFPLTSCSRALAMPTLYLAARARSPAQAYKGHRRRFSIFDAVYRFGYYIAFATFKSSSSSHFETIAWRPFSSLRFVIAAEFRRFLRMPSASAGGFASRFALSACCFDAD